MADMVKKQIRVVGRVQGVGFRDFTREQANKYGIVGYVRNLSNGDVDIEAAGRTEDMERFLRAVKKGPPASVVHNVSEQDLPVQNLANSFDVRHF